MDATPLRETAGREDYYNAALACIVLRCEHCGATLDPDTDLGPDVNFHSDHSYILLGDEAFRRGWLLDHIGVIIKAICPLCVKQQAGDNVAQTPE